MLILYNTWNLTNSFYMEKLKTTKIYRFFKRIFFGLIYLVLRFGKNRSRIFYFSKWVFENSDYKTISYPLNNKSIVLDVGGYTGIFSSKIISLYNPYLTIFEPVNNFFKVLKRKYSRNTKIQIYKYGLSDRNTKQNIYLSNDGTSLIKKTEKIENIELKDVATVIKKHKSIDLMSINIEGSEYVVIERLTSTGLIKRIKYLQVQFHDFVPNAIKLRKEIIRKIKKTHNTRYSYPFVWESFEIKNSLLKK